MAGRQSVKPMLQEKETRSLSRRAFLKGRTGSGKGSDRVSDKHYLPWTTPEGILQACHRCDACRQACPEGIIVQGDGGFPTVSFKEGECTFCGDCRTACPEPVFHQETESIWPLKAFIHDSCLARQHIQCQSCQDHCDPKAIRFRFETGSIPQPIILQEACTGCGACVSVCPAGSLSVSVVDPEAIK